MNDTSFDWHKFYDIGCRLLENGNEEDLRTAINRFYYGAFCYSRDYLIDNNIFFNADLKEKLLSDGAIVHSATKDIFKYEHRKIQRQTGKKIHDKLSNLRTFRNKVDYDKDSNFNLLHNAKTAKAFSKIVFDTIDELNNIT